MNTAQRKIIIDCDPGIDDALAIFIALAAKNLNVLGITTVAGNVNIDYVTRNALSLATMAGARIPVCRGCAEPLYIERRDGGKVHGINGAGGVALPEPTFEEDSRSAVQFIWETAERWAGELELATIGPLTNIATALRTYPSLSEKIKGITMMGGSVGAGNVTPAAEFNMAADPHAAAEVFQSGIPIDMYGLNVTNRAFITREEMDTLRATGQAIPVLCSNMLKTYTDCNHALHDPCALAGMIDESLVVFEKHHVSVETQELRILGKTVVDLLDSTGKLPNARIAMEVDRTGFIRLLMELLCAYD